MARPIGVMEMLDQGEVDDKIIAVHTNDPEYAHYQHFSELPPHRLTEVKTFFEDYKALENKTVVVKEFLGPEKALEIIELAIQVYEKNKAKLIAGTLQATRHSTSMEIFSGSKKPKKKTRK
jgi:inorganic pyrophosphatase